MRSFWLLRSLFLAVAAIGAVAGAASFALGTCHDSGGFCADEFSGTHIEGYAGGSMLLGLAAGLAAAAWTLRPRPAVAWGLATVGAVAVLAFLREML